MRPLPSMSVAVEQGSELLDGGGRVRWDGMKV